MKSASRDKLTSYALTLVTGAGTGAIAPPLLPGIIFAVVVLLIAISLSGEQYVRIIKWVLVAATILVGLLLIGVFVLGMTAVAFLRSLVPA